MIDSMTFAQKRRAIANPGDRTFYNHVYAINNEFGVIAIVYADCAQDALDEAADAGKLDCQKMDDSDYEEYVNEDGEHDDCLLIAGNACEYFWQHYLGITELA